MKIFFFSSILLSLLFTSCSSDFPGEEISLEGVPVISIKTDETVEINSNNLDANISFLELMVPEEIIFRLIKRVKIDLNSVFVLEYGIQGDSPRLFSFNVDGELNYIIDKQAQGPGEYESLFNFDIYENQLVLTTQSAFLFYDALTGDFISSVPHPKGERPDFFKMINDSKVLISNSRTRGNTDKKQISVYDLNEEKHTYKTLSFTDHSLTLLQPVGAIYSYEDTLSVIPEYTDVIFRLLENDFENSYEIKPAYKIDFGSSWVPDDFLKNSYNDRGTFFTENSNYVYSISAFENTTNLFISYKLKGSNYLYKYDKSSVQSFHIRTTNNNWFNPPIDLYQNSLVSFINADDHPEFLENFTQKEFQYQNPIVGFVEFQ